MSAEPFQPAVLPALNGVTLATAAATYAAMGVPVHPLLPGSKRPATPHGFHDATTDVDRVDRWWARHPDHNVGVATGHVFDVVDVDVKRDAPGLRSVARLHRAGLLDGVFATADTPTGGVHLCYAPHPDLTVAADRDGSTGLDYRGRGGYVVAAPSVLHPGPDAHVDAPTPYRWTHVADHVGGTFPWQAAMDLLRPPAPPRAPRPATAPGDPDSLARLQVFVESLQPGNRNGGLFWAATRAVAEGHDPEQLRAAALSIGLEDREVTTTLRSARRRTTA